MKTLTFSGKRIHSLEDLYDQVTRDLALDRAIFGKNLDALYDVLSDKEVTKISIIDNTLLKKNLSKSHRGGTSEYALFLDVITDLDPIEITLSDV
jgi:RNAse (barnase) inhibitor barstar